MVGVVGSSPIAPTKQNPLCWAVKGSTERLTLFVVLALPVASAGSRANASIGKRGQVASGNQAVTTQLFKHVEERIITGLERREAQFAALRHVSDYFNRTAEVGIAVPW